MLRIIFAPLLLVSTACQAVSFLSFDAESMALGGAGSATVDRHRQPHLNPATFSKAPSALTGSSYLGLRFIDRENFLRTVQEIGDSQWQTQIKQQLNDAQNAFAIGESQAEALRSLGHTANALIEELDKLPNKPLRLSGSAGIFASAVGERHSIGVYARQFLVLGAIIENDPLDLQKIGQLSSAVFSMADVLDTANEIDKLRHTIDHDNISRLAHQSVAQGFLEDELHQYRDIPGVPSLIQILTRFTQNIIKLDNHLDIEGLLRALTATDQTQLPDQFETNDLDVRAFLRHPLPNQLNSVVIFSGAEVSETALNWSANLPAFPALNLGANLKEVEFSTIAYIQRVDEFHLSEYKFDSARKDYRFWNLDLGFTYDLATHWTVSGVVKNIFKKRLTTILDTPINVEPIARAGIAYKSPVLRITMDVDLTRNEPLGFDPDKQYLSFGTEVSYWLDNTVRFGYRYNAIDQTGLPAIGLGFRIPYGQLDIAATYSPKEYEAGLAVQAGLMF